MRRALLVFRGSLKEKERRPPAVLLGLVVAALSLTGLTACLTVHHGHVSVPASSGSWRYVWHFESEDLIVNLGSANFEGAETRDWLGPVPFKSEANPQQLSYLPIWLFIRPKKEDVVLFEPLLVGLTPNGAEKPLLPVQIVGPVRAKKFLSTREDHCEGLTYSKLRGQSLFGAQRWPPSKAGYSIESRVCFTLFFEADASPDQEFTLTLRGLSVRGEPLELPVIRFRKARYMITEDLDSGDLGGVQVKPPRKQE